MAIYFLLEAQRGEPVLGLGIKREEDRPLWKEEYIFSLVKLTGAGGGPPHICGRLGSPEPGLGLHPF